MKNILIEDITRPKYFGLCASRQQLLLSTIRHVPFPQPLSHSHRQRLQTDGLSNSKYEVGKQCQSTRVSAWAVHIQCKVFWIRLPRMQNISHFNIVDPNLLHSTFRMQIPWMSLAATALGPAPPPPLVRIRLLISRHSLCSGWPRLAGLARSYDDAQRCYAAMPSSS